jgi:hypothetical protein
MAPRLSQCHIHWQKNHAVRKSNRVSAAIGVYHSILMKEFAVVVAPWGCGELALASYPHIHGRRRGIFFKVHPVIPGKASVLY